MYPCRSTGEELATVVLKYQLHCLEFINKRRKVHDCITLFVGMSVSFVRTASKSATLPIFGTVNLY